MRICKLKKIRDSSYNYNMLRRIGMIAPMAVTCGALVSFLVALLGYALLGFLILTRFVHHSYAVIYKGFRCLHGRRAGLRWTQ